MVMEMVLFVPISVFFLPCLALPALPPSLPFPSYALPCLLRLWVVSAGSLHHQRRSMNFDSSTYSLRHVRNSMGGVEDDDRLAVDQV